MEENLDLNQFFIEPRKADLRTQLQIQLEEMTERINQLEKAVKYLEIAVENLQDNVFYGD